MLVVVVSGCGAPTPTVPVVQIEQPAAGASVPVGEPLALLASATHPDAAAVEIAWDLGDGTTVTGLRPPPHRYLTAGTYVITASGTDTGGAASVPATRVVEVGTAAAAATGNHALRFGGTGRDDVDRVKIALHDGEDRSLGVDVGGGDMTIELWLRARPGDNPAPRVECGDNVAWISGHVVVDRDRYNQGRKYGLSLAGGAVVFGVSDGAGSDRTVCGATRIDDDRWHHVAVTRVGADGAVTIFVDGVPDGAVESGPAGDVSYPAAAVPEAACGDGTQPCTQSDPFLVLGAEKHDVGPEYPSYRGLMDELRLSTVVRYPGPFAPPRARFELDADTGAVYHFDEGAGPVARDSAGRPGPAADGILRIGGDPAGPGWEPSDAPTGG